MVDKLTDFFDKTAKDFGLPFKMPRPGKKALKRSAIQNGAIGVGLVGLGVAGSNKALVGLGIVALAGSAILMSQK